jgi:outer membrane protein TolC
MHTILKTRTLWILTLLLALPSTHAPAQERLTLPEAVRIALENNQDLATDAPGQEAARQEYKAAKAGYLPRLDFEQSYQAGNNPVFVFSTLLSQQRFTANNFSLPELNSPSPKDNLQTKITGQQILWDFGRTSSLRNQAQLGIKIADQSHEDHKRRIMLEVFQSYYAASLARSYVESAAISVRSAEAIETQAKARVESGLAVDADLLRSRVYISAARQQAIQAQGQLESAQAQLNRLMGVPLDRPIGETSPLLPKNLALPSEEQLLAEHKQRRPDYQNLLAELKLAEIGVQSKQKEFLPIASGYGTWEADNPSLNSSGGNNWAAGITLQWNLFAGGRDAAQLAASRQRLEQKRRQKTAMESAMALEIRNALIQQRAAGQEVQTAQAAELQSEEGLRILRNRYENGLATMTDLLSVEAARSAARTNLAEAIYRYRLSCAQVEYAAGILSPASAAMNLQ